MTSVISVIRMKKKKKERKIANSASFNSSDAKVNIWL